MDYRMEETRPFSLDSRIFVEDRLHFATVGAVRTEQGWICIDTPADPLHAAWWRQALQSIAPMPILAVIYTDATRDRVMGTPFLLEGKPALIIAHHHVFDRLRGHGEMGRQQLIDLLISLGQTESAERLAHAPLMLPNLTFSDRLVLKFGAPAVILEHVDGASPGQIWVRIPEHNVVFVGDTVTLSTHPNLGEADLERWLEQLEQLRAGRVARHIVPGRGPLASPSDISPLLDYLKALMRRVRALAASSRKPELGALIAEFMAYFPVPEYERERVQRRIRSALERLLELYAAGKKAPKEKPKEKAGAAKSRKKGGASR